MKTFNGKFLAGILAVLTTFVSYASSHTDSAFKDAPIRIVVAFSPGGPGDLLARRIGQKLSKTLDTQVIIENKTGAGGQIATTAVSQAKPDGHTLLVNTGALTTEPVVKKKLPYNFLEDLTPISKAVDLPAVIVVNESIEARTLSDFVKYAKENPTKISFGSSGFGSSMHLAGELMRSELGIEALHVPYAGGTPVMQALMAGEVSYSVAPISMAKPMAQSGKIHPLAVSRNERVSYWPEVPSTAEVGFANIQFTLWFGFFAPPGTPKEIVEVLNAAIRDACRDPEVNNWISDQGFVVVANTAGQFQQELVEEAGQWRSLAKKLGIKPE
jgi:tripartite-type tricarboxylate transporter receptor subunit TctC